VQAQMSLKQDDGGGTPPTTLLRGKHAFQIFVTQNVPGDAAVIPT
jgi:hypothetical protein